jgi:hypothetical protein
LYISAVEKLCNFLRYIAAFWSIAGKKKLVCQDFWTVTYHLILNSTLWDKPFLFYARVISRKWRGKKLKKNEINTYNGSGEVLGVEQSIWNRYDSH